MIVEPGDPDRTPPVPKSSHLHTNDELIDKKVKPVEVDDQAIQIILMGLPKDSYAVVESWNHNGYNVVQNEGNQNGNGNVVAARAEGNGNGNNANQIRCYNYQEVGHYARNCTIRRRRRRRNIEEVNKNCILMANLQQASTSGTQTDKGPFYDSDGSVESSMDPSRGIVEQHPSTVEETRAFYESLYNNLFIEVEKVNTVNRKTRKANVLKT
ncbi:retrovirus-related pol polyprotein from transposon TNT 1-94 [Tanacetum coccineum]